jgi:hypothetical protein
MAALWSFIAQHIHIAGNIENILPTNISLHAKQVIVVGLIAIIPPKNYATLKETVSRDFLSSGFCMNHFPWQAQGNIIRVKFF